MIIQIKVRKLLVLPSFFSNPTVWQIYNSNPLFENTGSGVPVQTIV